MQKKFYGTVEISKMINFHQTTVAKWIDKGKMASFKTIGGHRKVETNDLLQFLITNGLPVPSNLKKRSLKILLMNDSDNLSGNIKARLLPHYNRLEIDVAVSEVDALIKLGKDAPDVFIFDLSISHFNGLEIYKHIRNLDSLDKTQVLMITDGHVNGQAQELKHLQEQGRLFHKPINYEALSLRIEDIVNISHPV